MNDPALTSAPTAREAKARLSKTLADIGVVASVCLIPLAGLLAARSDTLRNLAYEWAFGTFPEAGVWVAGVVFVAALTAGMAGQVLLMIFKPNTGWVAAPLLCAVLGSSFGMMHAADQERADRGLAALEAKYGIELADFHDIPRGEAGELIIGGQPRLCYLRANGRDVARTPGELWCVGNDTFTELPTK